MRLSRFAENAEPYVAGEQPRGRKLVKLNTNENPYSPPKACERVLKNYDIDRLKLYPDLAAVELKKAIAEHEGVTPDFVFVGNGSDEVLSFAFRALFDPHAAPVMFPKITYSFYPVFCAMYGINSRSAPMGEGFEVDVRSLVGGQGAVIANPNAPTSLPIAAADIEWLLTAYGDSPVIADEAYIDFATRAESAVGLLKKHSNLAVVKTFSKSYSLAGIRCGYMVARPETVKALERVRDCFNSYPVDSVCQAVCAAAMREDEYHRECVAKVIATRERTIAALRERGKEVLSSDSNFLFVRGGRKDYEKLRDGGVLVRWFDKDVARDYTRVTVGSDEDMDAYLSVLFS